MQTQSFPFTFTDTDYSIITHRLQGDAGKTCLPCPAINWCADVQNIYPEKNGHNTPYYKPVVLNGDVCTWLDATVERLERSMPDVDTRTTTLRYPEKKRCVKCNRAFFSNKGEPLRPACVVECGCTNEDGPISVQMCTRCKVLQWLFIGSIPQKRERQHSVKMAHPLYKQHFEQHPGYTHCPGCQTLVTLANFRRIT